MRPLTNKQRRFVKAYVGKADGNAVEAARIAGYAVPDPEGCRLLGNARIQEAIVRTVEDDSLSANEVLSRLSDMATADMADFMTIPETGNPTVDLRRAKKRGKTHLIKSFRHTKYGYAIELHDPQSALEKLGRYLGLFKDKLVLESDDQPSRTRPKLERIATRPDEPGESQGDPQGG